MDDYTRLALEADIAHWDGLAHATRPDKYDISRDSMALCREFYHQECAGCPMAEKFKPRCIGTQYHYCENSLELWWERNHKRGDESTVRATAQRRARFFAEELRSVHEDNRELPPPPGVLDSLEAAVEVAVRGGRVGVLFNRPASNPLARGLLLEIKERYPNDVDNKRRTGLVGFNSGGVLVLLHKPEEWKGQEFKAVFVHSKPSEILAFELLDLYARIQ